MRSSQEHVWHQDRQDLGEMTTKSTCFVLHGLLTPGFVAMTKAAQKHPTYIELTCSPERFRRRGRNSVCLPSPQPHQACLHSFPFPARAAVGKPVSCCLRKSLPISLPISLEGPFPPPGAEIQKTTVSSALLFPEMQVQLSEIPTLK